MIALLAHPSLLVTAVQCVTLLVLFGVVGVFANYRDWKKLGR